MSRLGSIDHHRSRARSRKDPLGLLDWLRLLGVGHENTQTMVCPFAGSTTTTSSPSAAAPSAAATSTATPPATSSAAAATFAAAPLPGGNAAGGDVSSVNTEAVGQNTKQVS